MFSKIDKKKSATKADLINYNYSFYFAHVKAWLILPKLGFID